MELEQFLITYFDVDSNHINYLKNKIASKNDNYHKLNKEEVKCIEVSKIIGGSRLEMGTSIYKCYVYKG